MSDVTDAVEESGRAAMPTAEESTEPRVAAVRRSVDRLAGLADHPVEDHADRFDAVHRILQDALTDAPATGLSAPSYGVGDRQASGPTAPAAGVSAAGVPAAGVSAAGVSAAVNADSGSGGSEGRELSRP